MARTVTFIPKVGQHGAAIGIGLGISTNTAEQTRETPVPADGVFALLWNIASQSPSLKVAGLRLPKTLLELGSEFAALAVGYISHQRFHDHAGPERDPLPYPFPIGFKIVPSCGRLRIAQSW